MKKKEEKMKKNLSKFYFLSGVVAVVLAATATVHVNAVSSSADQRENQFVAHDLHHLVSGLGDKDRDILTSRIGMINKLTSYNPKVAKDGTSVYLETPMPYEYFKSVINPVNSGVVKTVLFKMERNTEVRKGLRSAFNQASLAGKTYWLPGYAARLSGLDFADWSQLDNILADPVLRDRVNVSSWTFNEGISSIGQRAFETTGLSINEALNNPAIRVRLMMELIK